MCDNNKTDIHTHIISGVDDGAQNQEQMIQMLLTAKEQGINRIVATPHCYPGKNRYDLSYIQKCFQIAKNAALEIGIEMYLGSEVFYRYGLAEEIEKGEVLTMADSSYILVEFSPETSYRKIYEGLRELVQSGYRPILAHMERYTELFEFSQRRDELRKNGVHFQINASGILGGFFDKRSRKILKMIQNGEVSFLASDAHNNSSRKNRLGEAAGFLQKKVEPRVLDAIVRHNAQCIIDNKPLANLL